MIPKHLEKSFWGNVFVRLWCVGRANWDNRIEMDLKDVILFKRAIGGLDQSGLAEVAIYLMPEKHALLLNISSVNAVAL